MKLSDTCWRLSRTEGITRSTVSQCTRGDSTCDEFFVTEREAWLAEAKRAQEELERRQFEVQRAAARVNGAKLNAAKCSVVAEDNP